ncbi:MAG TPA: hypothetical protein VHV56_06375 [Pseudolabrys sp.]|jgi:hypothetical protein|nr:hypothetical protein [Pseudolabrys sp.]
MKLNPVIGTVSVVATLLAFTATPTLAETTGAASADHAMSAANHPVKHHRHMRQASGQIACIKTGCVRIPARCYSQGALDFRGNPTGYDAVICP